MSHLSEKEKEIEAMKPKRAFGVRHIQAGAVFLGLLIAYGIRVCMSVAIVAMTDPSSTTVQVDTFEWSRQTRDTILSSFFWGYVVSQIPAGIVAEKFGGKYTLCLSLVGNGILCMVLPIAASLGDWGAVCACRVLQGLFQGMFYPSSHALLGKWSPTSERGRISTAVYGGSQFGTVVALLITGELCGSFGWPWAFYTMGIAAILWSVLWVVIGADTPSNCRYISKEEKDYIMASLGQQGDEKKLPTPWRAILTSLPFWALAIAHCGQNWGFWTLLTEMPTYMKEVLGVDIKSNGKLSALPYLVMWIVSFIASFISDYVINRKLVSTTTARKVANTIAHWGPGIALIGLSYVPSDITIAVALLTVTVGLNGTQYVGFNVNHIDLAPNFAGILMGITNCLANILSIIAPLSVSLMITDENQGEASAWRPIFFLASGVYFLFNLFFILFGTSEQQPWNNPQKELDTETAEETPNKEVEEVKRF